MHNFHEKIVLLENLICQTTDESTKKALYQAIADIKNTDIAAQNIALQDKVTQLENEKDFYLTALNCLPNPIFIKNEQAEFIFFNRAYTDFFSLDECAKQQYLHKTVLSLHYLPPDERKRYHEEDLRLIENNSVHHYEKSFQRGDNSTGHSLYWSSGFHAKNSEQRGLVGEIVDISTQINLKTQLEDNIKKLEIATDKIAMLINHDSLTNLFNRRILEDSLQESIENITRDNVPCCLLLADLDHFKMVNDNYGHIQGDKTLVDFANILKSTFRKNDILIRYGGEEFFIILPYSTIIHAEKAAQRLRQRVEKSLILPDGKNLTVSIGVVELHPNDTVASCKKRADIAMYSAKNNGRNQVVVG